MRHLIFMVALAGCYAPSYGNGDLACAPDGTCPDGLACNPGDQRCYVAGEAPVDAAPDAVVEDVPPVAITFPVDGSTTAADVAVTFTSTAAADFTFECTMDEDTAPCTSGKAYTLASGSHTFAVRAVGPLGTKGAASEVTWTVDTRAATITIDHTWADRGVLCFWIVTAFSAYFCVYAFRKPFTAATYDARIIRDRFGVPHIYGKRNADVVFGLAYAHAEDDWKNIEEVVRSNRGTLAELVGESGAKADDFLLSLGNIEVVNRDYDAKVSPAAKAIAEGYAAGLNLWCAEHTDTGCARTAPVRGQDIIAGYVNRPPSFYGLEG